MSLTEVGQRPCVVTCRSAVGAVQVLASALRGLGGVSGGAAPAASAGGQAALGRRRGPASWSACDVLQAGGTRRQYY